MKGIEKDLGDMSIRALKRAFDEIGALTGIRDRRILFNVMVNYVTGELFTADSVGTRKSTISDQSAEDLLRFSASDRHSRRFVMFLGKEGYPENMEKCNLGLRADDCADAWTGGPLRILNLSDRETILITSKENVGAISRVRSLGKYQAELKL